MEAPTPRPMKIEARNLSLAYGKVAALRDLRAEVQGRIIGVLGPTASGKTSLLQVLAGLIPPSGGEMRIDGEPVPAGRRRDAAYVPQETGAFPFFQRPKETLSLALSLRGVKAEEYPQQFLEALGLGEEDRSAAGYSAGMKQKVRIAYAMIHTPRLLLLDEPMTGLDVRERFRVLRLLDRLRRLVTVVFSTHHPEEAAAICDEILILNRGQAVAFGNPVGDHGAGDRSRLRRVDPAPTAAGARSLGRRVGRARRRASPPARRGRSTPRRSAGSAPPHRCLRIPDVPRGEQRAERRQPERGDLSTWGSGRPHAPRRSRGTPRQCDSFTGPEAMRGDLGDPRASSCAPSEGRRTMLRTQGAGRVRADAAPAVRGSSRIVAACAGGAPRRDHARRRRPCPRD